MTDSIDDADNCAQQLVRLYGELGEAAMVIRTGFRGGEKAVIVVCLDAEDVQPILEHVLAQYEAPEQRTVN